MRHKPQAVFTVPELSELSGYSVRQLRRFIADGWLQVIRRRGTVVITVDAARLLGRLLTPRSTPTPRYRFMLPVRAFAAITGRTERHVRHLIDKEALGTVHVGRRVFVRGDEIDWSSPPAKLDRDGLPAWGNPARRKTG